MSTILWQGIVFGPIHSRRLGSSLGINLLPSSGKVCNFDCIYCECGWNKDGRTTDRLPSFDEIRSQMESALTSLHNSGESIDTITFSGNGEPTLHPDFPEIIDLTISLRDRLFPDSKISVLSNSTTAHREEIRTALMKTDNPIMKIDGGDESLIAQINKPSGSYSRKQVLDALGRFEGNFILQTMFLKGTVDGINIDSTEPENVERWIQTVKELRPREVMIYTIDRETPSESLTKVTVEEMETIAGRLRQEGFTVQVRG